MFKANIVSTLLVTLTVIIGQSAYPDAEANAQTTETLELTDFAEFVNTEANALSREEVETQAPERVIPDALRMVEDYEGAVIFIDEGAGYQNSFYLDTQYSSDLIFENVSCVVSSCVKPNLTLTPEQGVTPGQRVSFSFRAGDVLTPKLLVNGALSPAEQVYWSNVTRDNVDGHQHVMAWKHNGYLVIGFEDMDFRNPDNDKDYNDLVFVFDIGARNLENLPSFLFAD